MEDLIETLGDPATLLLAGLSVGFVFGVAAYTSRFCLRAATVEVAEGHFGARLAIWLVAFLMALTLVQGAAARGGLDVSAARQLAATGSVSGAILGGLMFGAGMVLARGCASRLLVLSASGNLRAIVTGLVLTLTAQASLGGVLAPAREALATLWTVPGGADRSLLAILGLPQTTVWALAAASLVAAVLFGALRGAKPAELLGAAVVGLAVFLGWLATFAIASASFEIVAVQSVTFTGPSTDTLMALVNERSLPMGFGTGLVPGVFLGAFLAAFIKGEARIQRFGPDTPMERYLIGGTLMGFGSMLAGGCAVGAGVSGGSILSLTAWIAVLSMWVGAMTTHRLLTRKATTATV
ncbi:MAG: YeeE/YedE family protein [Paracoccaceae bacterium]|nr:YeeE/YedE family protein [Paracoccaceae bacterium]